jgi:hypothetical protein
MRPSFASPAPPPELVIPSDGEFAERAIRTALGHAAPIRREGDFLVLLDAAAVRAALAVPCPALPAGELMKLRGLLAIAQERNP